jgi:2-(1,2-epoxy-1,2-dihydrophenyl)acetyl-CoA isomerase
VIATEALDGVSVVRLDRPAQRNAMIPALLQALVDSLKQAAAREQPIILTGSGPAFCVGADLRWLAGLRDPSVGVAELVAVHHLAITTLIELPVPVIAALNGWVAGGGIGLALANDYLVAGEDASFIAAYSRLGLTPDGGASIFLERAIGLPRTRELLLTNRRLGAREALAWGMVNEVTEQGSLLARAVAFARGLEPAPVHARLETRRLLDVGNLRNQLQLEAVSIRTQARGQFFRDALRSFRESHPD